MEPAVGSFEYLNRETVDKGFSAGWHHLREPEAFAPRGFPVYTAVQLPRYEGYPGGAPFPYLAIGLLVFSGAWTVYSGAKDHFYLPRVPKGALLLFDVGLLAAFVSVVADTLVTTDGTYRHYGSVRGLEGNGTVRQWAAWARDTLGINFAWAMLLQDVLEGFVIFVTWYYGRKERNLIQLLSLWFVGFYQHGYLGWASWDKSVSETFAMIPGVLGQLGGASRKYQGGGPQTVIGVV